MSGFSVLWPRPESLPERRSPEEPGTLAQMVTKRNFGRWGRALISGKGRAAGHCTVCSGNEVCWAQLRLPESWQCSPEKSELTTVIRRESAGQQRCWESHHGPDGIPGRVGPAHGKKGAVPAPCKPQNPSGLPVHLLCTQFFLWYPHMAPSLTSFRAAQMSPPQRALPWLHLSKIATPSP